MPVPPQVPIIIYHSPAFGDRMLVELWNTEVAKYDELQYGTPHPDTAKYPNFQLVKQAPLEGDEKWVQRFWFDPPALENTYNAEKWAFDGEDNLKDMIVRSYLVKRTAYAPLTKKSTLTGVLYVTVSAGGSGYDSTTTATITGGGGSGATAVPIVFRGAVVGVYVTAEGTGYTLAPYITISGIGTGALATAQLQKSTCILVEESAQRLEGSPEDGLYLRVTRLYHVLPGALLTSYTAAADGKLKKVTRQKVALPYYPSASGTGVIGEKVDALSTVMGWRIIEEWANADGSTVGAVPWITHSQTVEPEGVKLVTFMKPVSSGVEAPPMGRSYLETAGDMAAGATYTGRRRVPTFPSGQVGILDASIVAGEWENAQAYIVHSERRDIEDSPNKMLIVQTCPVPRTRSEFPEVTYQFPALLRYDSSATPTLLTIINGKIPLRVDPTFVYLSHRTRRVAAALIHRYSAGVFAALSNQYKLTSPGAGSVFFGQLDANTIYGNVAAATTTVQISNDAGLVEEFAFSSLSGCSPLSNSVAGTDDAIPTATLPIFYRLKAEQAPWKGNIFERQYLVIAEDRNLMFDSEAQRFTANNEGAATTTQYLWCR